MEAVLGDAWLGVLGERHVAPWEVTLTAIGGVVALQYGFELLQLLMRARVDAVDQQLLHRQMVDLQEGEAGGAHSGVSVRREGPRFLFLTGQTQSECETAFLPLAAEGHHANAHIPDP